MEYKILLGISAVVIQLISYGIYFWGIYIGKTKPHAFTWFVWSVLNTVAALAVLVLGGYFMALILGINALACFVIAIIGFRQKHVIYDKYDWLALAGVFVGVFLWQLTLNPLLAIIFVCISELFGVIPTFRKAYKKPFEENLLSFAVGSGYYILALLALEPFSLSSWLYPAVILVFDISLVLLIFFRRRQEII